MSGPRLSMSGPRVIMSGPLDNYVGAPTYYVFEVSEMTEQRKLT